MNEDAINQLNEQMRALADILAANGRAQSVNNQLLTQMAVAQGINLKNAGKLDKQFDDLYSATNSGTMAQQANAKAANDLAKAQANYGSALTSATASVVSLGKSFLSAEKGFTKFGTGISSAGDAALSLGKNFGIVGMALGGLVKGFTMVAEAAFKQTDASLKAVDDLSSVGGAGQFTSKEVLQMGHKMGLTSANLDVFTKAAKSVGTGLTSLAGNAGDGIKEFAKLTTVSSETRQQFQRMGVSQEELMERQADFVKLQEQSSQMITKRMKADGTVQQLSLQYAESLTIISSITGRNAKEAAEGQKRAKARADIQMKQLMMQREEESLRKQNRGDEADNIKKQRLIQDQILNAAEQTGDAQLLAATQSKLATGAYTEQSASLLRLGIDVDKIQSDAAKKSLAQIEKEGLAGEAAANYQETYTKKVGETVDRLGSGLVYSEKNMEAFGLNMASLGYTAKNSETDFKERNRIAREEIEKNKKGTGKAATDPAQNARNALTEAEIKAKVAIDELVLSMNPLMNGFDGLTTTMKALMIAAGLAAAALTAIAAGKAFSAGKGLLGGLKGGGTAGTVASTASKVGGLGKAMGVLGKVAGPLAAVTSIAGGAMTAYEGYNKATTTEEKGAALGKGGGQAAGGAAGAMAGAAIGTAIFPVVGTAIGAAIGGWLGSKGGEAVGESVGKVAGKALTDSPDAKRIAEIQQKQAETEVKTTEKLDVTNNGLVKSLNDLKKSIDNLNTVISGTGGGAKAAPAAGGGGGGGGGGPAPSAPTGAGGGRGISGGAPSTGGGDKVLAFSGKSGSKQNFEELDSNFKQRITSAAEEYNSVTGKKIQINSAKRDSEDQLRVYQETVDAGRPGRGPTGMPVAKPGRSKHEQGRAVDIQNYSDPAAVAAMNNQGLFQTVPRDPVHFELPKAREGGLFTGPDSGYPVELHGRELVLPFPDTEKINKESIDSVAAKAKSASVTDVTSSSASSDMSMLLEQLYKMMEEKFDNIIGAIESGNDTSDKLLKTSRV